MAVLQGSYEAKPTALTRLDDSYSRSKDADRLIDFWIALESLFLPDDGRVQEMAETAATVVACYIGKTASERTTIRNNIKRSHVVRLHIVHGKPGHPPHDFAEMTTETGMHLRRAMWKRIMK